MNIQYDHEADAAYIRVLDTLIAKTEEESDVCILDFDSQGNPAAIELLSVFGFAGASLHSLVQRGLISREQADLILRELRSELIAA